ncbi:UNVERIFIED_CONTAM: hypothetical protein NCL1_11238 [Trichonephila clavipes]
MLYLQRMFSQIPQREKVAPSEAAASRAGPQKRLEGLLGVSEGNHPTLLPVRQPGRAGHRHHPQAPHHRGRGHHAAHPRAPQKGLHLLSQHSLRGRLPLPKLLKGPGCVLASLLETFERHHTRN